MGLSKDIHIIGGVFLAALLILSAAVIFATTNPEVSAEPVSSASPEKTTNLLAEVSMVCGEEAQTCGLAVECCEGMYCSSEDICESCASALESCGAGVSCCPGNYCYMGSCVVQTEHFCSDSENGPDYYSPGTASGELDGVYGAYSDYCLDSEELVDYYCEVNNEYSPVLEATLKCPNGCLEGSCN